MFNRYFSFDKWKRIDYFLLSTTVFSQLLIDNFDDTRQNLASMAKSHRWEKVIDNILSRLSTALVHLDTFKHFTQKVVGVTLNQSTLECAFQYLRFHDSLHLLQVNRGENVSISKENASL